MISKIPVEIKREMLISLSLLFPPYEKGIAEFYTSFGRYNVAVDIGAGCGLHTWRLARISNKVIAIEPVNKLGRMPSNVELHAVAVGRKRENKDIKIFNGRGSFLNAGFKEIRGCVSRFKTIRVKVVPLNDIVTKADFLKIDTEGYEVEILESAKVINALKVAVIELHNVRNLEAYQSKILEIFKDYSIYANDLKRYVTKGDIPLAKQHLLCVRRGIKWMKY